MANSPLRDAQARIAELQAEATRAAEAKDDTKLEAALAEAHTLKARIEKLKDLDDLSDYAGKSAGMVPLVSGGAPAPGMATIQNQAGTTTISNLKDANAALMEYYGEGQWDPKIQQIISTDDYRKSFRSYMRTGVGAQTPVSALRTLQDGADTSGGFLVPSDVLDLIISKEPTPIRVAAKTTQLSTSRDHVVIPRVNYTSDDLNVGVAA